MPGKFKHAAIARTATENKRDEFLVRERSRPLPLEFFTREEFRFNQSVFHELSFGIVTVFGESLPL